METQHDKVDRSISNAQAALREEESKRTADLDDLDRQLVVMDQELTRVSAKLRAAEQRMLRAQRAETGRAASPKAGASPDALPNREAADIGDVLEFVARPGFDASPVTVDVLRLWLHDRDVLTATPPADATDSAQAVVQYAHAALNGAPSWDGTVLGKLALARSLAPPPVGIAPGESRLDLLLGGLYHTERTLDADLVERILARLVGLVVDDDRQGSDDRLDLMDSLQDLERSASDSRIARRLGAVQTKLATAHPRALQDLYDRMSAGLRARAKRELVSRVPGSGLHDADPTHEVLDVVSTHLATLLAPLESARDAWSAEASLQDEVRASRQTLLASTARLPHVFSPLTNDRLAQFKDLFGRHLTDALTEDTLEAHELFRRLVLQYCLRESRQPEWISSRYLLPIVIALGHVASRADRKIRERKADVRVALEKQQQPLNAARQGIPLRIRLENVGAATASDMRLEIEADRQEVVVRPRETVLTKRLGPSEDAWHDVTMDVTAPVDAIELACLYRWRDPSGAEQWGEGTLKLTAQRDVEWDKARANPYSLRSITSQERLVGRDADLDALRSGIDGTQSFCVTGQKRVGKTSVVRVLLRELRETGEHVAVYLPFGDLEAATWPRLVYSLYEAVREEVEDVIDGCRVNLPGVEDFLAGQARYSRAFVRSLERGLAGKRVVCIVDDFDEIDESLYKGAAGKELFLRLRTLIDIGSFSFVMVGSEKLPDVLRHQGERLNQVQEHSLSHLREKASLRRLVVEPARPHLRYTDEAIDSIWRQSAGNPYYATQICVRVYGDMVARRDHYVSAADVQRSVEEICRDANVNTFQHFWKDGVFGEALDATRVQHLNALILLACARCCEGAEENDVERSVVLADPSVNNHDPARVRSQLDRLVDRGVMVERAGRVKLQVPLFEKWLLTRGEAAVRGSFAEEDLESRLIPSTNRPASRRIVELADNLVYQGHKLSEDRVRAWLEQFGPAENQNLALRLLERLKKRGWYDEGRVRTSCKGLHRRMLEELAGRGKFVKKVEKRHVRNVFVTHFEDEGSSGGEVLYKYRTANDIPKTMVGSMDDAVNFGKEQTNKGRQWAVVFVDDFVGGGGTCVDGLKRFRAKLETGAADLRAVIVGVAAVVGFEDGVEAVETNEHLECYVVAGDGLGVGDRAFAPEAGIFDGEEERGAAEGLVQAIGSELEPKHPLGFDGAQALVCFGHRCPNNTLPIFYKSGATYRGQAWIPLFPR